MDDIFSICDKINSLLEIKKETEAREELIKLLDYLESNNIGYTPLINHLIRATGLYQYIKIENADWSDRFVAEVFKVNVGERKDLVLHREQSRILKRLLNNESIAISAPTSFGKSFIIDAFIAIKKPRNVVIIAPTISLADETRRRLYRKFSGEYRIITLSDEEMSENNIFIFPQERAFNYLDKLSEIDILIVDEFYKAGTIIEKGKKPILDNRATKLLQAILELNKKTKQRYFLAPNIADLKDNPFTKEMPFEKIDFNTVYTQIFEMYKDVKGNQDKEEKLLSILDGTKTKSLIYVGTYPNIDNVTSFLNSKLSSQGSQLLNNFSDWLNLNYGSTYVLSSLVHKGVGVHNGRLHRSLSQLQIKLFNEEDGLSNIVSTSSIIEGVNTSAENVIIWANKNGPTRLNSFTYKNIIGRGGRMFKHFIGKVYLLDAPPSLEGTQLQLDFTDDLLGTIDTSKYDEILTETQKVKAKKYNNEMDDILGEGVYKTLLQQHPSIISKKSYFRKIASDLKEKNQEELRKNLFLNSDTPADWDTSLYYVFKLVGSTSEVSHTTLVNFIKILSYNWEKTIPEMINLLSKYNITIEDYFRLERFVSFELSSFLGSLNILLGHFSEGKIDISPFISKTSNAFLPKLVYELEEYGLPRMLSKKINESQLINLTDQNMSIKEVINKFHEIGKTKIEESIKLHPFELYILNFFFEGITLQK